MFCDPPEDKFVIAKAAPQKFTITINLPPGSENKERKLFGEHFVRIADSAADGKLQWVVNSVMRGMYQLLLDADSYILTVNGKGATDVTAS